jgi:hypothetical protein
MTIKELKKFGTLRRAFKGKGIISLSNGSELPTRFALAQQPDGQLLLSADINRSVWEFAASKIEVQKLTGTLLDGRAANVSGPIFLKAVNPVPGTNKVRLIAYPSNWTLGNSNFSGSALSTFEIVNFRFLGTQYEVITKEGVERGTLSLMPLTLGNREVQLRQVSDYEQVEAALQTRRGVEVTCTATTTLNSFEDMGDAVSVVDTLCDVMSVARAALISWISFEVTAEDGTPLYSQCRNSVTRRYTGTELIHRNDPDQTKRFLERGFIRCCELDQDFQMRRIARAYIETRDGPFIETRSLLIAVLAEYLAGVRVRLDTLNHRTLSWRLNHLMKWLELNFEAGEVEQFVATRNKLAHEGSFPSDGTPAEHYQRMQHFLDRMMLRLFDYHGSYYDFEHSEFRQI